MNNRISRRLFLSGAALLGAGIALNRVRKSSTPVADQGNASDVMTTDLKIMPNASDAATPTLAVTIPEPTLELFGPQEVVAVAAGESHSLALTRSGEVVAWGGMNTVRRMYRVDCAMWCR